MNTSIQYIPSYKQRKNIFIGTILALSVTFLFFIFVNRYVFGENTTTTVTLLENAQRTMQNYSLDMGKEMTTRFTEMDTAMNNFSKNTLGDSDSLNNLIKTIAGYLVIIHFLLNIIQEAQKGEATAEMWLRVFLTLAISLVLITNSNYLFTSIEKFGDGVFNSISARLQGDEGGDGDKVGETSDGEGSKNGKEHSGLTEGSERKCDYATLVWLLGKDNADNLIKQSYVAQAYNAQKPEGDGNGDGDGSSGNNNGGTTNNTQEEDASVDSSESKPDPATVQSEASALKSAHDGAEDKSERLLYDWDFLKAGARDTSGISYKEEGEETSNTSSTDTTESTTTTKKEAEADAKKSTTDYTTAPGTTTYDENAVDWTEAQSKISIMTFLALLQIAMNCTIDGLIYTLAIQIFIRKTLAPIAISDISIEGTRSTGMRYIKHFFALYVQKVIIFMIGMFATSALTSALTGTIAQKYPDSYIPRLFLFMTISGCITGMMTQAGTLAKEIVGD